MEGALNLANRGITQISDIYSYLAQWCQNIISLDLSGNYLK